MKVNGQTITIPRNLLITLPANTVSFVELVSLGGVSQPVNPAEPVPSTSSRLTLNDLPKPFTTWEVSILGNRFTTSVTNPNSVEYIAAIVNIAQQSLQAHEGEGRILYYVTMK